MVESLDPQRLCSKLRRSTRNRGASAAMSHAFAGAVASTRSAVCGSPRAISESASSQESKAGNKGADQIRAEIHPKAPAQLIGMAHSAGTKWHLPPLDTQNARFGPRNQGSDAEWGFWHNAPKRGNKANSWHDNQPGSSQGTCHGSYIRHLTGRQGDCENREAFNSANHPFRGVVPRTPTSQSASPG